MSTESSLTEIHAELAQIAVRVNTMLTKRKVSYGVLTYQADRLERVAARIRAEFSKPGER